MKKRIKIIVILLVMFFPLNLFAQYLPPAGVQDFLMFYSPFTMAAGVNAAENRTPIGNSINPAYSGSVQRITTDFNYTMLLGLGTDPGWGNIINTGLAYPTKYGVFTGSIHFFQSPFGSFNTGILGGLDLSFSKDLFPNLLVGMSLNFRAGAADRGDWGLSASLGGLYLLNDVWLLHDFKVGFSLSEFGKGYAPVTGRSPFPAPFTPNIGASFSAFKSYGFDVGLNTNLSAPSFTDIRLDFGLSLSYSDFITLRSSYRFDLMEILDNSLGTRTIPFSFGASVRFQTDFNKDVTFLGITEKGWNKSEVNLDLSVTPLQNGIWAIGFGANVPLGVIDKNPPVITLGSKPKEYISPNLDGTQDSLIVPIKIKDERYIKGYKFIIKDKEGNVVRTIINKDNRPENLDFNNIIDRLLYVKSGIKIPEKLVWDGKSDNGSVVADGLYSYYVESWDDNGNFGKSDEKEVVVDNTPPKVTVKLPYKIFSPNGDGNKDTLPFLQEGSVEDKWEGYIEDLNGNRVKSFEWKDQSPKKFEWDGKNNQEKLVPDGVYNYTIRSIDRAGNSTVLSVKNIIINTQATPINITIDNSYFSPNNDGVQDTIKFVMNIPVTKGIVDWKLNIVDAEGKVVKTFSGGSNIPTTIQFKGDDNSGKTLPEGEYQGELSVVYENGNNPTAKTPTFNIDITPPSANVKVDPSIFSPNGDGRKDFVTIYQETSNEIKWTGKIINEKGKVLKVFTWRGKADSKVTWDGRGNDGTLLNDGSYKYIIETTDRAGNFGKSDPVTLTIDTKETPVFLSTNYIYFSPNSDGEKDTITITPHVKVKEGIETYRLQIKDSKDNTVKEFSGKTVPKEIVWDGLDSKGEIANEGVYYAVIDIKYLNGNNPVAKTQKFHIDVTYPSVKVTPLYLVFSPDNDGNRDSIQFKQQSSNEDLWEGDILDSNGKIVRSFYWKGEAKYFSWDGKDDNGNKLPDGKYGYRIKAVDKAGNKTVVFVKNIVIDTKPTPVFVTVSDVGFSPNNDGFKDTIVFTTYITLEEGIKDWALQLRTNGKVVREFNGTGRVPATITWDGKSDTGSIIDGSYTGILRVEYIKGNRPEAKTNEFKLDTSSPRVNLNIHPIPFSPDNDGVDDELFINISVDDLSPIKEWSVKILDPKGNEFTTFSGIGTPSNEIVWNGISNTGELVQAAEDYRMIFSIVDIFGNSTTLTKTIPIDVLVIREGDKLKIRISSITFAPNTADFESVEPEKAAKNQKTLKRLAEILNKYKNYSIRIEGHAVNLSWYDPVKAEKEEKEELIPLSLDRARAVKKALVKLGVDGNRISTVGLGGSQPIVPFSDVKNRWKDRRVEFILIKK